MDCNWFGSRNILMSQKLVTGIKIIFYTQPTLRMHAKRKQVWGWTRGELEVDDDSQRVDSDKYISVGKHNIEGYVGHNPQRRQRSIRSESGNKSHSDYSHLKPGHRPLKSDQKKSPSRGSNSFYPSVHGHSRQRSGSYPTDETAKIRAYRF